MATGAGDENAGPRKAWKTIQPFSTLPAALGNRVAIPTFPSPRRRLEGFQKQSSKSKKAKGQSHEL
ncbi:MAG: hypothetical protein WDN23_04315 [Edaphobacter sp.]